MNQLTQPITILSIHSINTSQPSNITQVSAISHIESLINQSMSLSSQDRLYAISCIQSLIINTFPLIHTESDTKRLINLYRFTRSIIDHM
jgi:hypothetical protein